MLTCGDNTKMYRHVHQSNGKPKATVNHEAISYLFQEE